MYLSSVDSSKGTSDSMRSDGAVDAGEATVMDIKGIAGCDVVLACSSVFDDCCVSEV